MTILYKIKNINKLPEELVLEQDKLGLFSLTNCLTTAIVGGNIIIAAEALFETHKDRKAVVSIIPNKSHFGSDPNSMIILREIFSCKPLSFIAFAKTIT